MLCRALANIKLKNPLIKLIISKFCNTPPAAKLTMISVNSLPKDSGLSLKLSTLPEIIFEMRDVFTSVKQVGAT